MNANKKQVGGKHYMKYKIQPIEFITQNNIPFIEGNVIKYLLRYKDKNGMQDLDKCIHYIELLKDMYHNGKT
ncbi:hypothetical protein MEP402_gp22 [Methylophilales phage MEP402]|nr:hypothetical protein MEP402_gp22 [Methylophilales phage MEP402]